jgi:hypothetical protein
MNQFRVGFPMLLKTKPQPVTLPDNTWKRYGVAEPLADLQRGVSPRTTEATRLNLGTELLRVRDTSGYAVIQEQFGRGPLLWYCHVSASYCISTLPLGNVGENEKGCLSHA